jgi:hypothetical protein
MNPNMNEWDRDNLEFLLNTDENEFHDWFEQADDDDIDYAYELVTSHRKWLKGEVVRALYDKTDSMQINDFSMANQVLSKIMEK